MELRKLASQTSLSLAITGLVSGIWLLPQAARAENYFDLSIEQLLETRVLSASKKIETVAEAPAAIYVVTSEDISRSGVTSIPDALRMVPGVNVARSDSNTWAITIRGFNSPLANKLLVLIDGRSIYNPVFGGVLWDAHSLMLEDIERIEVIRGPGGSLWGANAVNGVINIITKHTNDTQGNLVTAVAGNQESNLNARHGGSFGDDGTYRVYARAFKQDNSPKPGGGEAYDEWDGMRAGFRADWGDKFTLQGDIYRTSEQQRIFKFSLLAPFNSVENQEIVYNGVNILGRWADKYDDGAQLSVQTYIDWARRDEPFNLIDNRMIYDIEAQYNFAPMGVHELVTGVGFRFLADNETGNNNVSFSPQKRRNSLYSMFVQDKITLSPEHWHLTLGSKFEHNEFSGSEVQPNIRLQWQPNARQTLWSSVSRAVRTPTPVEDDLTRTITTGPGFRGAFVPNDDFQSERLTAYELGYRNQITSTLAIDMTAFYNDYDRLATFRFLPYVPVVNGIDPPHFFFPVIFTNDMEGKTRGFETSINWTLNDNLKIALDYSYLRLTVTAADPAQEGAELLYPKGQTGLKIYWNMRSDWTLDTTIAHIDKLPGSQVDAYTRLDVNLGGQLSKALRFNLVGQNLLDKTHREFTSADDINAAEIERNIFAKLTWMF